MISTETFLGRGAVGGFVVTPGSVGRDAAQLASRILDGADPSTIAVATDGINKPVFDWRQLQRWKIDASRLPSDSEIRFRDPTVWDQYRLQILAIVATILLQTGLIAWLIYEHRRRHSAEIAAREAMFELTQMDRIAGAGQLSASIAHEVIQPLAAIDGLNAGAAMSWLKAKTPDIDEAQAALTPKSLRATATAQVTSSIANLRRPIQKGHSEKRSWLNSMRSFCRCWNWSGSSCKSTVSRCARSLKMDCRLSPAAKSNCSNWFSIS